MSTTPQDEDIQPEKGTSNTALMWLHLTWWSFWIVAIFIWFIIRNKHPQATSHGKNVLNACITEVIAILAIIPMMLVLVYYPDIQTLTGVTIPEFVLFTLSLITGMFACVYMFILIYSVIRVVIATRKDEILPYFWAIRFFAI
jgi:uncharacterized Tic20 family protein